MNRIRLLIVDEVRSVNSLTRQLSFRVFEVIPVGSGREALEHTTREATDLILLDPTTPGTSCEDVESLLAKARPTSEVILIGSAREPFERFAARPYLQKPVEITELLRALRDAFLRLLQRRLSTSGERLLELAGVSDDEPPLITLGKLRELEEST